MFKMKKKKAKNNMFTTVLKPSLSLLQCEWVKKKLIQQWVVYR